MSNLIVYLHIQAKPPVVQATVFEYNMISSYAGKHKINSNNNTWGLWTVFLTLIDALLQYQIAKSQGIYFQKLQF